eukprot:scaffold355441_cov45-Prasinocladus_malaysianus.AAC.1
MSTDSRAMLASTRLLVGKRQCRARLKGFAVAKSRWAAHTNSVNCPTARSTVALPAVPVHFYVQSYKYDVVPGRGTWHAVGGPARPQATHSVSLTVPAARPAADGIQGLSRWSIPDTRQIGFGVRCSLKGMQT